MGRSGGAHHTTCTTIRHIMGMGRSSAATSHVRPNRLSAGIPAGPLARAATSASNVRDADRKANFVNTHAGGFLEKRKSECFEISNDRRSHFTAAAPKAAAAGENQVSVAPLAHCETRLEGTLSPRFSRAHADALVS